MGLSGPIHRGLIKLKDEHPPAGEVGNKVLSPLTCPPARCTHGGGSLAHQPRDAFQETQPGCQPLTLWVPDRAAWLSWVRLARCQASIYQYSAQVDKILKYFQVPWQIASASSVLALPSDLGF